MPNYVKNIIKMQGICKLLVFTENDGDLCFDFNKLIPMPESLNVESGSKTDEGIVYYLTKKCTVPISCLKEEDREMIRKQISFCSAENMFQRVLERTYNRPECEKTKIYEAGRIYVSNYRNYGATTWYDWCCDNWDTKWNAGKTKLKDDDTIIFDTAWDRPKKVIVKLSEMYPDMEIAHVWADEEVGYNTGCVKYKGGIAIEEDYFEDKSNAAYDTYIQCWGASKCIYKDRHGNWKKQDCETCNGC